MPHQNGNSYASEARRSYIYEIRVDGIIRYIGKGTGRRVNSHIGIAKAINERRANGEKVKAYPFQNKFAKALKQGAVIKTKIVVKNLTDEEAFAREILEIADYKDGGKLWNWCEGGNGFTSADAKRTWANPEYRRLVLEVRRKACQDPEVRRRMSEASRKTWQNPEVRRRKSEAMRKTWQDPGYRRRLSEVRRDPEYRRLNSELRRKEWQDPEVRRRRCEVLSQRFSAWSCNLQKGLAGNIARQHGINAKVFRHRLRQGLSIEEAIQRGLS